MKDEIKEILDKLKMMKYDESSPEIPLDLISRKAEKTLLDYITNLQEKVNQYENPDDMTLFYMWLDEKAKDKIKHLQEKMVLLIIRLFLLVLLLIMKLLRIIGYITIGIVAFFKLVTPKTIIDDYVKYGKDILIEKS